MKTNKANIFFAAFAIATVFAFGFACKSFTSSDSNSANTTSEKDYSDDTIPPSKPEAEKPNEKKVENADFTMTSEELDKEFTRKGVTDKDLEKYSTKNIAVTGRVTLLSLEKKGTTQPWVTLFAPGLGHGVSCYFDDDNLEQMKQLKDDKIVTVQGFQNDFIVPEISPSLDHCVVLKAD